MLPVMAYLLLMSTTREHESGLVRFVLILDTILRFLPHPHVCSVYLRWVWLLNYQSFRRVDLGDHSERGTLELG